jgi:hypothetical protein
MTDCTLELTQDAEYNLIINKDRDLNQAIQAEIFTGTTSGSTVLGNFNFGAYTGATLTVKIKQQDNYSVIVFSTDDGSIVLGSNGIFNLVKTAAQLENIKAGTFYYDMYLSSATLRRRAFLRGSFTVIQNVGI